MKINRHLLCQLWLISLGLILGIPLANGQSGRWSIGLNGGLTGYAGDLSRGNRPVISSGQSVLGLHAQWQSGRHWAFDIALHTGQFSAKDSRYTGDLYRLARAFSFQTQFIDLCLTGRRYWKQEGRISPFLGVGIGGVRLSPRPDFSQTKLTELLPRIEHDQAAGKTIFRPILPLSAGFSANLNARVSVDITAQVNLTFYDYLDGISLSVDAANNDAYGYATLGFYYRLLPADTDRDGIPDAHDECPELAGSPAGFGCPDADNDGVADVADNCPTESGPARLKGCPDRDGDLVPDAEDECPDQPGWADLGGCPWKDTDNDGTPDYLDPCPDRPGPADRQGCPAIDSDGDGLLDEDDFCPEVFGDLLFKGCPDSDDDGIEDARDACPTLLGSIRNDGCPEWRSPAEEAAILSRQLFVFTPNSNRINQLRLAEKTAELMRSNPAYQLVLRSHDDAGHSDNPQEQWALLRAKAVYDYLLGQGVDPARLRYEVLGSSQPLSDAETPAAREQNRRVELQFIVR